MSSISITLDSRLARAVRATNRWREASAHRRLLGAAARSADFLTRGVFYVWRNRRYLTVLKLANIALIKVQCRLKTERVIGRPYKMKIESTNICNTKCQLCPTGVGLEGRPKGKMSLDQYKRLIDRLGWHLYTVDLSMWGDPMIVPELSDMIRYAHDKGIWTYISSNMHAYKADKGHGEKLVRSGLDMITCSLHGATQETFAIYQPGKNFAETVAKVRDLVEAKRRLRSATPAIQLNFVVTRHNEHEQEAFKRLAEELDAKAIFSWPSLNVRFLNQDKAGADLGLAPDVLEKKVKAHLDQWLPTDKRFVLKAYQDLRDGSYKHERYNGSKMYDCHWPWKQSVINWDGQVVTCCGSWAPEEDMGSVFEQPFGKIWNGRKYRLSRRSFKKKVEAKDAEHNPCANCPGYML